MTDSIRKLQPKTPILVSSCLTSTSHSSAHAPTAAYAPPPAYAQQLHKLSVRFRYLCGANNAYASFSQFKQVAG